MRKLFVQAATFATKFICCSLIVTTGESTFAQDLHISADSRLQGLWALYPEDDALNFAGICSQRYPQTHGDWDEVVGSFNARNSTQLAKLRAMQAQLLAALKAGRSGPIDVDLWATVLNARIERSAVASNMLASLGDEQAQHYCDDTRKMFAHEEIDEDSLKTARAATAAAVEDLGKH